MASDSFDLIDNEVSLIIVDSKKYLSTNIKILYGFVNKKGCACIYVTVNKSHLMLTNLFQREKINQNKIFVIDASPATSKREDDTGNVIFINSPSALTDISIATLSAIKSLSGGKKILFFDSISALLIYNEAGSVCKFAHFLINKLKEMNVTGVIIAVDKDLDEKIISQLTQFCDKSYKFQ